ncbi:Hypothetical protein CINCED_3A000218 [Cinara cedri]|uniref:Uncharacterized protein n=1 Tax=Cinara cedri TaxID=506608 RepID=A0A5E4MSI8_9HEMI|nr:Hypothetical protein CINCED_3A000218 [Cinara cedri]
MEVNQRINNSSINSKFKINSEEEIQYLNIRTIEVKTEIDLLNDCEFESLLLKNEYQPSKYIHNSKEEVQQSNNQTIEIKKEFDLINGCMFENIITIENDPMELILHTIS